MSLEALSSIAVDMNRLEAAYQKASAELLRQREAEGHWCGELATSALATATAVSALSCVARANEVDGSSQLALLIRRGVEWIAERQNTDGGWGDTELSYSNVSTTMLVVSAFHLSGVTKRYAEILQRAEAYLDSEGGIQAIRRRYGRDKTFAVPILTNAALAGLVPWKHVSPLPFELACFPQSMYRFLRLPVVSYAIPALVAIGQARFYHRPPGSALMGWIRQRCVEPSLEVLDKMQPASGGYLEAVPLTSFVVMSLASIGRSEHAVVRKGIEFLIRSVRRDGGWPIDTNLATWNTSLSLNALASGSEDLAQQTCLDWLLACQQKEMHPFTGAPPGGWGWSDLSGAVPDADDTPAALLAISAWSRSKQCHGRDRRRIRDAAADGVRWLRELQNGDGGWPTFCRGWGKLPFDRSGADLTAHAIRALHAWRDLVDSTKQIQRGLAYLERTQRADGSWIPLWFGNQDHPREENPVYGTGKVLLAYRDLDEMRSGPARAAVRWLLGNQSPHGGWGAGTTNDLSERETIEETAIAVEALIAADLRDEAAARVGAGIEWLVDAVERDRFIRPSPIGLYFAKLWYHERLYPIIFTVSALGRALARFTAADDKPAEFSRQTRQPSEPSSRPIVQA